MKEELTSKCDPLVKWGIINLADIVFSRIQILRSLSGAEFASEVESTESDAKILCPPDEAKEKIRVADQATRIHITT